MRTPPASLLRPLSFSLARLTSSLAVAAAISLAGASARAATVQWDPNGSLQNPPVNGSGSWSTGSPSWYNGTGDAVWNNAGNDIAQFNGFGNIPPFGVTLDSDITANSVIFNSDGYSIIGSGTTLTLTTGGATVSSGATALLLATVGGSNGLTLDGGGTLELGLANTYTGTTTVNGGSVLRVDNAASTVDVVLNASTLQIGNGTSITYNQNIALNDGSTLLGGAGAAMRSNGTMTVADNATVNINTSPGQIFTLGDAVNDLTGGANSTIQVGGDSTGTVILTKANNLTANWNVNNGTLEADDYGAIGTGSVTINPNATFQFNVGAGANINNPFVLNGGTLRQVQQQEVDTFGTITVNAPSTIDIAATGNFGKILINHGGAADGLVGTGDLTKTGHGILQIIESNTNYTGNWTLNGGFIEMQNNNAIGSGTVTVNTGGELVSSSIITDFNPIIIGSPGAILSFDNGNTGNFVGTVNAANDFTVGMRDFYETNVQRNGTISGPISGSGHISVTGSTTGGISQLTLAGNNSAWSGGIDLPPNVQLRVIEGAQHGLGTGTYTAPGGLFLTLTPDLTVGPNSGFSARYYSSPLIATGVVGGFDFGLNTPAATRNEDTIDLVSGTGTQPNPPIPGFNQDHNIELWTGVLNIAAGGNYTFFTSSDDGSLLYLDGQQLVQSDFAQGETARSGQVVLAPGLHSLIVKYGQGTGGGGMHAYYLGPDTGGGESLIGSIPGTVTNTGSPILGTTTFSQDIVFGASGNGFDLAAANATLTGAVTMQPGIPLNVTGVTGAETLTLSGPVTLNGIHNLTIGIDQVVNGASNASAGADMVISGNIGEAVPGSGITKLGPRTLTLTGVNTYTGVTTVNEGALQLGSLVPNTGISPAGLVINATAGNAVARLIADEQIPDNQTLTISSTGNNSALFDANGFTETVSGLVVTATGATSTGVLTGSGTLTVLGDIVLNNNRAALGNTGREVLISSIGGYTFVGTGGTLDLGGATRNITVTTTNTGSNLPGSDATIETNIADGGINKLGSQTLILAGSSTYAGGTTITAGTIRATGPAGATSTALGTGLVTLNGGSLQFRNNGLGNNGQIAYLNDLTIDPSQSSAGFDINNNGANTGNTIVLGNLSLGAQTLNVTGGNSYALRFNSVTLTGNAILNPQTGVALSLANISESGGSFTLTKPGTSNGTLILSGNGTFTGGTNIQAGSGPLRLVPSVGSSNKPAGTGVVSLASGTTMQITPTLTSLSSIGAVAGSLTAKFYNGGQTLNGSESFELPTAVTSVSVLSDGTFFNRPSTITPANGTNMLAVYDGLLKITTAGTYNFQTAGGDESQLLIDGVPVTSVNTGGGSQSFTDGTLTPVTLSAGFHTFTMKALSTSATGSGLRVRYQGADTNDNLQVIPSSQLYSVPALLNVANVGTSVNIPAAGTATIDSLGSAFDSGVTGVTLGAAGALNVANAGGTGVLNVSGNITLQGAGTLNLVSSALNLSGDFADAGNNFAVTKNGAGALILTGAKAFGGALTINAGGVQVTNPGSLGGITNGTVVTNTVAPLSSVTSNGSTTVTIPSGTSGLVVGAFVSGTGIPAGTTIAAIPSSTTITLSVNATSSATNTLTYAYGGALDLNGVALNAEPLTLSGGGSASSPAALYNSSSTAASTAGPITINAAGTKIGGFGDITLNGTLSGAATNDLTKIGADTLTINGSGAGTFLGTLTVSQGIVKLGNDNALGATSAGTTVSSGATLDLNGRTIPEPLSINGSGLVNLGGANTLAALINTNASAATVTGTVALLAATSSVGSPLAGGGDIALNGVVSGLAFGLNKVGPNKLTLGAANTYTGATVVQFGTLVLSGAGTTATESAISVDPSATLTLDDNSGANNTTGSRLGSKRLTLIGGNLNVLGSAAANTLEDLGTGQLIIDSQNAVVTLTPGSASENVRFNATGTGTPANASGLLRNGTSAKGTALFRGTGLGTTAIGAAGTASITFGGTIPTVGQTANTATGNTDRAIIPWALVDTTTGGSGSSFAAYSATNGLQALQPGDFTTTITTTPKVNNIVASSAISAPASVNTLINSLTLNAGGGLTVDSGSTITLDSGGILATANASISGAGTLASTVVSTTNREFIVQTAGAGTTLNISTPISINGGLTKSGNGTLTFSGQQSITGQIRLNAGTTKLAGGANTIAYAVTAPPAVGAVSSTPTSNTILLDNGATLDLQGNDQRFGGFASNAVAGTNLPGTSGTITNTSGTIATLRIGMKGAVTTLPTAITGNLNFQRDGATTLPVTSAWTYTGSTMLNGGLLTLVDAGALPNTSSLAIHRASLKLDDSGLQAATRLNATAPIALDGGAISFVSRSNTADALNLGAVSLNSGASLLSQSLGGAPASTNTGTSTVNIASLTRSQGATINFAVTPNGNVALGSNPRVILGTGTPTLTGGLVGGWATTTGYNSANPAAGSASVDFAKYDPVIGFRPTGYSAVFASGNNVNIEPNNGGAATTFLPAGDNTVNSLRLSALGTTTSNTIVFSSPSDVLNLESGGLLSTSTGNTATRAIGDTVNSGQLTAGGSASTGTSELFIHSTNATTAINAQIVDNPNGAQVALVLDSVSQSGGSTIQLNGTNTYSGPTYVNGVIATLNSPGLAIPGNLIISGGTQNGGESQTTLNQTVRLLASNQIASTANVTINGGGQLDLNNFTNTINNLTLAADGGGGTANVGPSVLTGTGALTLNGSITATNLLEATTIPVINGNLNLPGGAHDVAIGTFPGAPSQVGLQLNALLTGPGSLNVTSGVLGLGSNVDSTPINLAAGATLNVSNFTPTIGTLTGAGTVTGTSAAAILTIGNDGGSGTFTGMIAGPLTVVKTGAGIQTIASTTGRPTLTTNAGTLQLSTSVALTALNVNAGALTTLTAHAGGPGNVKVIDTSALTFAGNGKLDLTNNAMIVRGATLAAVNAQIKSGYNIATGYWDGPGINSSTAANDPTGLGAIGVVDNAEFGLTSFAGVSGLTGAEILVKYTYLGDADLSGSVDLSDFNQFFAGFTGEVPAEWFYGDFDYSGAVDLSDFNLFFAGLTEQGGALRNADSAIMAQEVGQMAAQFGVGGVGAGDGSSTPTASQAVVPEPGSIGLLAVGALGLLARRRRKA